MTFYYQTSSWSSQPQVTDESIKLWKHIVQKKNWRIVQLPNGFYQTEYKHPDCDCNPEKDTCCEKWIDVTRRETIEGAESAIDASINHYEKKLAHIRGPQVVKTFK
tara:strand:- start:340 stop:657 length:318 start_codon:yes stop_codon:yes gene_type:complete